METVIEGSTLEALRAALRGAAYAPGEEGYEEDDGLSTSTRTSTLHSWSWPPARRT